MNIVFKELGITLEDIENEDCVDKLSYYDRTLNFMLQDMKLQVKAYHAGYAETGINGNYNWFHKVSTKIKAYGLLSQAVKARFGRLKRIRKQEQAQRFERMFVDKAKKFLSKNDFEAIVDLVTTDEKQ